MIREKSYLAQIDSTARGRRTFRGTRADFRNLSAP